MCSPTNKIDLIVPEDFPRELTNHILSYVIPSLDSQTMTQLFQKVLPERINGQFKVPIEHVNTVLISTGQEFRSFLRTVIAKLQKFSPDSNPQIAALEKILSSLSHLPTSQFPNLRSLKRDYFCRLKADFIDALAIQPDFTTRTLEIFSAVMDCSLAPAVFQNWIQISVQIIVARRSLEENNDPSSLHRISQSFTESGEFHTAIKLLQAPAFSSADFRFSLYIAAGLANMKDLPASEMIQLIDSISDPVAKQRMLSHTAIALSATTSLDKALEIIPQILTVELYDETLQRMSANLLASGDFENAIEQANWISCPLELNDALSNIINALTRLENRSKALTLALSIQDRAYREIALQRLGMNQEETQ